MWELYSLLGEGFQKKYLLDETSEILNNTSPQSIKRSIGIIFEKLDMSNPVEVALIFAAGLKSVKFFEFQMFMEKLNGSSKR